MKVDCRLRSSDIPFSSSCDFDESWDVVLDIRHVAQKKTEAYVLYYWTCKEAEGESRWMFISLFTHLSPRVSLPRGAAPQGHARGKKYLWADRNKKKNENVPFSSVVLSILQSDSTRIVSMH